MVKGKLVLAGIGLALALGSQAVPAHAGAQGPARGTVETMHMDGTARSLDQSSIGSIPPPQWNTPRFDDSSWVPVRPVASGIGSCVRKAIYAVYRPSYSGAIYWGDNLTDHYLFRQTFSLPKAHDYYGSEIGVVGQFVASAFSIYINGTQVNTGYGGSSSYYQEVRYNIEKDIRAGRNVIAINAYAGATTNCTGLQFRAVVHAAGIK
jgi:hypothetical protein